MSTNGTDEKEVPCLLKIMPDTDTKALISLKEISSETRKKWVAGMQAIVIQKGINDDENSQIRPLNFTLFLDGSVKSAEQIEEMLAPSHKDDKDMNDKDCRLVYPSRYRIPPESIEDLGHKEKVRRAELFALGSLIYQIHKGHAPFEELDNGGVQDKYLNAEFPDVTGLEQWPIILSCWSLEFACSLGQILAQQTLGGKFRNVLQTTNTYIEAHPYIINGLKVAGVAVAATSLAAPMIFGAVGFSALGPVAGSSAAAWQASMGAVEAGSLFAWCQSAAMGGAAVNGIIAAGATGAGVASVTAAADVLTNIPESITPDLMELFRNVCRKASISPI